MMATVTTNRNIDLSSLSVPATARWDGTTCTVEADLDEKTLQGEVDAAPDQPEPVDRLAALEERVDAAAALAEKASVTAQDVAAAMKPGR